MSALVPKTIQRVVVVVNPDKNQIQQLVTLTNIDTIQFHGNENIELIKWVKHQYPNIKILKRYPLLKTSIVNLIYINRMLIYLL